MHYTIRLLIPVAMTMTRPTNDPAVQSGQLGVLLVNLGTPEDTSTKSVRHYLKEFLSDRRVVDIPRVVWWPLLNGVILNTRPKKSAAAYRKIWREQDNQSPLRYYTQALTKKLAASYDDIQVEYAMRYGQPAINNVMTSLQENGCDRIVVLPLYPQYSATTTATVNDAVFDHLKNLRWQPSIRIAAPYYDSANYIDALAQQIEDYERDNGAADKILLSFHGLPKISIDRGDPYYQQCQETGRLLGQKLDKSTDEVLITYQSRFGPAKWIEPYTNVTLAELPAQGVKRLLVLTPGFATDCLETLEEIGMEGVATFLEAGGEKCDVLPCLNDSEQGVVLMKALIEMELKGWK